MCMRGHAVWVASTEGTAQIGLERLVLGMLGALFLQAYFFPFSCFTNTQLSYTNPGPTAADPTVNMFAALSRIDPALGYADVCISVALGIHCVQTPCHKLGVIRHDGFPLDSVPEKPTDIAGNIAGDLGPDVAATFPAYPAVSTAICLPAALPILVNPRRYATHIAANLTVLCVAIWRHV